MANHSDMFRPAPGTGAERAEELRRRYPRFVYERFEAERAGNDLRVRFHFRAEPDIEFAPETVFPGVDWARVDTLPKGTLENLLFHLGLVELLSYWKATCSPEIRIEAGHLSEEQIAWFRNLLRRGMGEYFYVNGIDWRAEEFVRVVVDSAKHESEEQIPRSARDDRQVQLPRHFVPRDDSTRDLVPTSGGKDSVVTLELLRETQVGQAFVPASSTGREARTHFNCLLLNPTEAAMAVARQAGCANPIIVRRTIDPRLLA